MEYYNVDQDIHTICVRASSFPDGVLAAHQKLHLELFPPAPGRDYFGISYGGEKDLPENTVRCMVPISND